MRSRDWSKGKYYDVSFAVHKSRRYHALLRDFYQSWYDRTVAANAFGASGAFFSFLGSQIELAASLSAVVALASLFESIFKPEKQAELHHELCGRFTDLAADIETWSPTKANLARARSRRLRIERDEPAVRRLIDLMAQNEEARARGVPEARLEPLSWCQCKFGYVGTFGMRRLERKKARREAAAAAAKKKPRPWRLLKYLRKFGSK